MNQVLRTEVKYAIPLTEYYRLADVFRKLLHADAHNGTDGYPIRSLYFDTISDRDYWEKVDGTDPRRKIRLRCYDPAGDGAALEMKQKQGMRQRKRSIFLNRQEARALIAGDYTCLLSSQSEFALECYGLMQTQAYRPKAVIAYDRMAFIAPENKIRVTFDRNLRATQSCFDIFSETLQLKPVMDAFNVTLEVKYDGFLPSYIKDIIRSVDGSALSIGKYCAGRF